MNETIQLGEILILVTRKAIKNVHLSVHPPEGRVTLVAPSGTRLEVARAYNESIPGAKELEEKFIWSRHEAMAHRIEEWLMRGRERVFVAVGALHLAGPRGLVEMFAKRGYQVRQL